MSAPWLANVGEGYAEMTVPDGNTVCISITEPGRKAKLPAFVDLIREGFQDYDKSVRSQAPRRRAEHHRIAQGRRVIHPSLRRRAPMKRTALARGTKPLQRSRRLNPVNRKRAALAFERDFGAKAAWIRSLDCCVPGCWGQPIEAAHAKSRGAGGTREHLVALCSAHHRESHDLGARSWGSKYGLDLLAVAATLEALWQELAHELRVKTATQEGAGMAQNGEQVR